MDRLHLLKLVSIGHEVGAHTVNHRNLDELSFNEKLYEISTSLEQLSNMLNKSIVSFAYPRGRYDLESAEIVKKNGLLGFTTHSNYLFGREDYSLIPRFPAPNGEAQLLSIINGNYGKLDLVGKFINRFTLFK